MIESGGFRVTRASTQALTSGSALNLIEAFVDPTALALATLAISRYVEGAIRSPHVILALLVFLLAFPGAASLRLKARDVVLNALAGWLVIAMALLLLGYLTDYVWHFNPVFVLTWLLWAPLSVVATRFAFRRVAPAVARLQGSAKRAVICGINTQGLALARRIGDSPYVTTELMGFFDDRTNDRFAGQHDYPLLGKLTDLPGYVKRESVGIIYLSLPMAAHPSILKLFDDLRDTTVSIYFVPDLFVTDVIQGRVDMVDEFPVVAVCETPFVGLSGIIKRISDIVLSAVFLFLAAPLMLAVALGVKLTSPGPVLFKQRRYGLGGEEILVYKFRSMTVCEDGSVVRQAQKGDSRVTPFGAFLRKSSLDELPQFLNVLQGQMSIVGPRPHAVAHNEMYRKLVKGYMVRHKVKPGITGWAQVNGCRGETDTVDKMQRRIDYDLEYLRNWSPRLDFFIIFKTFEVVLRGSQAY